MPNSGLNFLFFLWCVGHIFGLALLVGNSAEPPEKQWYPPVTTLILSVFGWLVWVAILWGGAGR